MEGMCTNLNSTFGSGGAGAGSFAAAAATVVERKRAVEMRNFMLEQE